MLPLPAEHRLFIADLEKFHGTTFGGLGYQENTVLVLGDTSATPSLIFIGDSHAGQYAAAFDSFLRENGKSAYLYYVNACLMMPGGSAHMYLQQTKECLGAPAALEALLIAHPLPVIQAQSWESYQNGTRFISSDGVRMPFMQAGGDYYDTILTTIAQMKAYLGNRRYLVLGVAPGIEDQQPIARCLSGPRLFTEACEKSAAAPEDSRLTGQAFNIKFAQYAATNPAITFLNPRAALCHDGYCYALDEGRVLYSDRSHLTKDGARKVLTHFQEALPLH